MRYNPNIVIWILIILFIILLVPLILVFVFHWNTIVAQFDPYDFVSEYLKFLAGLLSLSVGFLLVNLYWERKLEFSRATSLRRLFLSHLEHIGRIAWETGPILDRHIMTRDESLLRDQEVVSNKNRLGDAGRSIVLLADEITSTKDEQLIAELALFVQDIVPRLDKLSKITDISPGNDELQGELAHVGKAVLEMSQRLKGAEHEPDSTGGQA